MTPAATGNPRRPNGAFPSAAVAGRSPPSGTSAIAKLNVETVTELEVDTATQQDVETTTELEVAAVAEETEPPAMLQQ